jgi:hypothetical protein
MQENRMMVAFYPSCFEKFSSYFLFVIYNANKLVFCVAMAGKNYFYFQSVQKIFNEIPTFFDST